MSAGDRMRLLTDEQWGRPFADHRCNVEGILYRYRTGVPLVRLAPRRVRSLADSMETPPSVGG